MTSSDETPELGSLRSRLPANFSPEAHARLLEIASMAKSTAAKLPRPIWEYDEPAHVFDMHMRPLR
jgi:hypothetical protein